MPPETDYPPDNEGGRGGIGTCSGVRDYLSLHNTGRGRKAENTEKAEGNRNRPLRAHFPHYMGRGKVEGMLCLQHAAKERIRCAIQEVYENIANPNMEAEKARKLTIELTFKPDKNDRTDVDVTAIVKTSLQPQKAIASRMIVESDGRGNVLGAEWSRETMKGQMELAPEETQAQEENIGVIDLQAQKRKAE